MPSFSQHSRRAWGSLSSPTVCHIWLCPRAGLLGAWAHSLLMPLSPQATYVLLALAWVFVPIYISSEVSLFLGPWQRLDPP